MASFRKPLPFYKTPNIVAYNPYSNPYPDPYPDPYFIIFGNF